MIMDEYLTLLDETFSQVLPEIKVYIQQVVSTFVDAYDPLVKDLVKSIREILDGLLCKPKESFPKPPRKLSNKPYLVDKRSQIRQYSYFRR